MLKDNTAAGTNEVALKGSSPSSDTNKYPPSVDAIARNLTSDSNEHPYAIKAARDGVASGDEWQSVASERFGLYVNGSLKTLINMSGVILHTGLGRARLADEVVYAVNEVADSHASVEFDLESGARGDRQEHVRWLLQELTGAEDALVVNNCAAAVMLALSAQGRGQVVLLSRGQVVEIGGQFRMPDIIEMSGCYLVEVGCTNKTHLSDYANGMDAETGVILRCHQSNFAQVGFVSQPEPSELADLAHSQGWLYIDDLGSGCLINTTRYGLGKERTVREAVADGADIAMFSGDKLLGGTQAGIIVGKSAVMESLKKHPLARAMRIDKLSLAGLEATLRMYFENRSEEIPVWRDCAKSMDEVKQNCFKLRKAWGTGSVETGVTELGGGSFPGDGVRTWRFGLGSDDPKLMKNLRTAGVIGRIQAGQIWLDPRTATQDEVKETCGVLKGLRNV